MLRFEVTQVLALGESTFIVARQIAGGPFDVSAGSRLGGTPLKPVLDVARSSMTHEEPTEEIFVFTAVEGQDQLPKVGEAVELELGTS